MNKPLHFYLVFNPMINQGQNYKTQAHEFYNVLKNRSQHNPEAALYWGKLKVNQMDNFDMGEFQQVIDHNQNLGKDTHLYISDYHHFWVAKVSSVHKKIAGPEQTLAFYDNKEVDMWFRITDMDLISAEFEETLYYLSQLAVDNKFHDQKIESLSPYLGGLKFPMIVEDRVEENYFRNIFTEDKSRLLKENPLISRDRLSGQVNEHMKSFVLSPQVYAKLSHNIKTELLGAEISLTQQTQAQGELYSNVLHSYLKILESILNDTAGNIIKDHFGKSLFISKDGHQFSDTKLGDSIEVSSFEGHIQLNAFVHLFRNSASFGNISFRLLTDQFPEMMRYFGEELIPFMLDMELVDKRLKLKMGEDIHLTKAAFFECRNKILGVGCMGVINELMKSIIDKKQSYFLPQAS